MGCSGDCACAERAETADRPSPGPAPPSLELLLARGLASSATAVSLADLSRPDIPLVYVNPAFESLTGFDAAASLGHNCRFLQCDETDPATVRDIGDSIRDGRHFRGVLRQRRRDGSRWWNELHLSPVVDESGRPSHYVGLQHDVSARIEAERRVTHLARHDFLTGLPNRVHVLSRLRRDLRRAAVGGSGMALLFLDLDGFKALNDEHGHEAGDHVLAAVATRLRTAMRSGDLLGRHGGDEFVAVVSEVSRGELSAVAVRLAEDLLAALAAPFDVAGGRRTLAASVGVALYPDCGDDADALLRAADAAMYVAKARGGGRALAPRVSP